MYLELEEDHQVILILPRPVVCRQTVKLPFPHSRRPSSVALPRLLGWYGTQWKMMRLTTEADPQRMPPKIRMGNLNVSESLRFRRRMEYIQRLTEHLSDALYKV